MGNKGENLFKVDNEDMKTISQTSLQYHRWSLDQVDRLPVFYVLVFLLLTVNIPWLLFIALLPSPPPSPNKCGQDFERNPAVYAGLSNIYHAHFCEDKVTGHPFNRYAKFSENLTFLTPWYER